MLRTDQPSLSAREIEIVKLVAAGLQSKEIAGRLQVSLNTVKSHLKRIFHKAGVQSRSELAAWWTERTLRQPTVDARSGLRPILRPLLVAPAAALALAVLIALAAASPGQPLEPGIPPAGVNAAEGLRTVSVDGAAIEPNAVAGCPSDRGAGTACGSGTAPAQDLPAMAIVEPETGSTVAGPDVTVSVVVTDFTLVPVTGAGAAPGEGHILYYLDFEPPFLPGQSAIPADAAVKYAASDKLSHTFEDVAPGPHTAVTLLVLDDHTPVIPPVIWSTEFVVIDLPATPAPPPSPRATEVARTLTVDDEPAPPATAVLPSTLPVVGAAASDGAGVSPDRSAALIAAGAALVALGLGSLALIRRRQAR